MFDVHIEAKFKDLLDDFKQWITVEMGWTVEKQVRFLKVMFDRLHSVHKRLEQSTEFPTAHKKNVLKILI